MSDTMREPSDARVEAVAKALDDLIEEDRDLAERLIEKHLARLALKKRLKAKQALAAADAVLPPQAAPMLNGLTEAETTRSASVAGLQAAPSGEAVGVTHYTPGATGFTMCCFSAEAVPPGTKLYTAPAPAAVPAGWQSIKTAPKDGAHILVMTDESDTCYVACWADPANGLRRELAEASDVAFWRIAWDGTPFSPWGAPTHWMPLPPPPNQQSGDAPAKEEK